MKIILINGSKKPGIISVIAPKDTFFGVGCQIASLDDAAIHSSDFCFNIGKKVRQKRATELAEKILGLCYLCGQSIGLVGEGPVH